MTNFLAAPGLNDDDDDMGDDDTGGELLLVVLTPLGGKVLDADLLFPPGELALLELPASGFMSVVSILIIVLFVRFIAASKSSSVQLQSPPLLHQDLKHNLIPLGGLLIPELSFKSDLIPRLEISNADGDERTEEERERELNS